MTVLALPAVALGGEPCRMDVEELIAGLQRHYDQTENWQAEFRQQTSFATLGRKEELEGRVYFKKPGRMRWEYGGKDQRLIVADGKAVWLYDPADMQVVRIKLEAAFASAAPYALLTGVGSIGRDFEVELAPGGCTQGAVRVKLKPRGEETWEGVLLMVDPRSFEIRGLETRDLVGNVTKISFEQIETRAALPASLFRFDPPPGVDVVMPPGS